LLGAALRVFLLALLLLYIISCANISHGFWLPLLVLGVFMSGFVSVVGSRRVAGVVARPLSCGWV
jgi:hypothetical protein